MANCPNCGSNHIQLKRETNVSWGRAITGLALFGVVGGAVGAVTGEDRNANACLDCGTSWKAEELYKILQLIKKLTDINPDLHIEKDRVFVNSFMSEITPYIEAVEQSEKEYEKLLKKSENKKSESTNHGCSLVVFIIVFGFIYIPMMIMSNQLLLIFLIIPISGILGISIYLDNNHKKYIKKEIENAKIKADQLKIKADQLKIKADHNFKRKVENLVDNYFMS
jgi:hypothetical protein